MGFVSSSALAGGAHSFGPSPYLQFADSPFATENFSGGYFYLENFEQGFVTTPGVSILGGFVLGPGTNTDSVDADDGSIDGLGQAGHSYYSNSTSIEFDFSDVLLGHFPTHAGLAWTDIGETAGDLFGRGTVVVEGYDSDGFSLGQIVAQLGDGRIDGTTAEDRFFGFINPGGISSLVISISSSEDWEIDHLQYGYAPEPASIALLGLSVLVIRRRR